VAAAVLTAGLAAAAVPAAASTKTPPSAADLYEEAFATTRSWSVHYDSVAKDSSLTIVTSGDTGPASGTQQVLLGKGTLIDSASIIVIGAITYLKANASALVDLAGFDAAQAAAAAGEWIEFATDNSDFSQIVVGVRSHDVAQELALTGPYRLGRSTTLDGVPVDAIEGTQSLSGHKDVRVILYVRADGSHVPVEEDSVDSAGHPTGLEHTTYSRWGETVRPEAPQAQVSVGPVSAV